MYDYDDFDYASDSYEDDYYAEPDIDESYEIESSLASAGWGTDEDYGYYGNEDAAMESSLFGDC